jgi:hypothetical protein
MLVIKLAKLFFRLIINGRFLLLMGYRNLYLILNLCHPFIEMLIARKVERYLFDKQQ